MNGYKPEDVFARVPEVAAQTDPVLKELDRLLEADQGWEISHANLVNLRQFYTT